MEGISENIERYYELMATLENGLGGKRLFREFNGRQTLPKRGVYIIFESGEKRAGSPTERVCRIGTHAIKENESTTLWGRLRNHRGTRSGGGNHRGSVFRKHIGSALINRSNGTISSPTWTKSDPTKEERSSEKSLEKEVSAYIGECSLLWLAIEDAPSPKSNRAFIEEHSIALLANHSDKDRPSKDWLGNFSPRFEIRRSGLWNVNHVNRPYDPEFLDALEKYVQKTISRA
jgi:hypothetical protein